MNKFEHLDDTTLELIGVAASIAGGCQSCLDYHFRKAVEAGCTSEQIAEAIELAKMIKRRPVTDIETKAEKLLNEAGQNI